MAERVISAREALRQWISGDCQLRMSFTGDGVFPVGLPLVSGHLEIHVDGYLEDGRQWSHQVITLPIQLATASRVATLQGAMEVVLADVVLECHGEMPDEALVFLADALSQYIRDVAAARARAEAGPILTQVFANAHVRMLVEEEGDDDDDDLEDEDEEEEEEEDYSELLPSPPTAPRAAAMGGQLGGEGGREEEEEEEERCAICLEMMGQQDRCWLRCSHSFHGACVRKWLKRKPQCPLCRLDLTPPGQ